MKLKKKQTEDALTERKEAEAEKAKLESQLRQAQKMEAIGTLAGGIAHDFNNILTVIIGCTELALVDTPEKNPAYPHLRLVREAGIRAADLVRQILAFSRQAEQEKKPLQPGSLVKEALKMLRSSLPSTIQIRQTIEEDPGLIMADPTQIHQILINLCTNAAQAMREKGGLLEVRLTHVQVEPGEHQDLNPGPHVSLTVSDTGQGMGTEVMERIFDPYFSTKAQGEGAGLGLAVVYGIVKSHEGAIKVQSRPGRGSTFEVFLPRIEYPRPGQGMKPSQQVAGGSERLLLVDDEEALIYAVGNMLKMLGYQVTTRTNSLEALETFHSRPQDFDLLITDMTMPHMTGVELSRKVKQVRPDLPIILCTGFSEMIDEKKAGALGLQAFVMKPFSLLDLTGTIRKVLDGTGEA